MAEVWGVQLTAGLVMTLAFSLFVAYYVLLPLLLSLLHTAYLLVCGLPRYIGKVRRKAWWELKWPLIFGVMLSVVVTVELFGVPLPPDASNTEKSYYAILGITQQASLEDIKSAFHKLAIEWHPDKHPPKDKEHAQAIFLKITEAYEYLKAKATDPDSSLR